MKKFLSIVIVLGLTLSTMAGCSAAATKETTAATTTAAAATTAGDSKTAETTVSALPAFKISMIDQLTGPNAFGGAEYANGAQLALDMAGNQVNGRKVELEIADGPTQEATLSEYERLYNDGNRFFISGYGCIGDMTFATMVDDMKCLYFSLNWNANLIQSKSDYFFRTGANVTDFCTNAVDSVTGIATTYLSKQPADLKIAIVYNTRLENLVTPFLARAKELGVQVVFNEGYPDGTTDFSSVITKLMNADYDILVPFQGTTDGTPFQKKMHEMNYVPPVTIGAGIYYDTPIFADLGNEITNGILTQSFTTANVAENAAKGVTEFRETYTAKFGHEPLTHALQAYSNMQIALKVLGSVAPSDWEDTAKLAAATKSLDIDYGELTWYWGVKFDDNNSNTKANQFIVNQWIDGSLKCVAPENLMTIKAIVPWVQK